MDLYDDIFRRRSTQKFSLAALDQRVIEKIKDKIESLPHLEISCDVQMHFINEGTPVASKISTLGRIKAPHYVVVTGTRNESCLISAGYSSEYLILYLTSLGIATSYMGSVMDQMTASRILGSPVISDIFIAIALGGSRNVNDVYRKKDDLKRLPLESLIISGIPTRDQELILEAVRQAPSFMNLQSWRFEVEKNLIQLHRENLPLIRKKYFSETVYFDMGIALAHLEIAANHLGYKCRMVYNEETPGIPEYVQTINLIRNKED